MKSTKRTNTTVILIYLIVPFVVALPCEIFIVVLNPRNTPLEYRLLEYLGYVGLMFAGLFCLSLPGLIRIAKKEDTQWQQILLKVFEFINGISVLVLLFGGGTAIVQGIKYLWAESEQLTILSALAGGFIATFYMNKAGDFFSRMKLTYSVSTLLLVTAIVGIVIAWHEDHKRMADDNKALMTLANLNNGLAAEAIMNSLDFTTRELHRLNEVTTGKVPASINLPKINDMKTTYCDRMTMLTDKLTKASTINNLSLDTNYLKIVYSVINRLNDMPVETAASKDK